MTVVVDREATRKLGRLRPPLRSQNRLISPVERLTDQPGTDTDAVLATASDGTIWMAWQAWRSGQADIELAPLATDGKLGAAPIKLSDGPADEWSPSIAADGSGRVHVAFDSYQAGNYDVILRSREPDGSLSEADHGRRHGGV